MKINITLFQRPSLGKPTFNWAIKLWYFSGLLGVYLRIYLRINWSNLYNKLIGKEFNLGWFGGSLRGNWDLNQDQIRSTLHITLRVMWINLVVTMAQPSYQWSSEIEVITIIMLDVSLPLNPSGGSSSMKVKLQESAIRSPVNSNKLSTRSCTSQAWTEQPMLD